MSMPSLTVLTERDALEDEPSVVSYLVGVAKKAELGWLRRF